MAIVIVINHKNMKVKKKRSQIYLVHKTKQIKENANIFGAQIKIIQVHLGLIIFLTFWGTGLAWPGLSRIDRLLTTYLKSIKECLDNWLHGFT